MILFIAITDLYAGGTVNRNWSSLRLKYFKQFIFIDTIYIYIYISYLYIIENPFT